MFSAIRNIRLISGSDTRTTKAKKNIAVSFIVKGVSILIMLALVPLLINQLDTLKYGIWLTIATFITWFTFFDIGLGNGLKNILTRKLAENDLAGARKAVSTAYISISALAFLLILIFVIVNQYLNWPRLLNAPSAMFDELNTLLYFVVVSFCFQLILRLITSIYDAIQMPAVSGAITAGGNLLSLLGVLFIIYFYKSSSLIYYGIAISIAPIIALLIGSFYFFRIKYPALSPSLKSFDRSMVRSLFSLGGKFFLIQITSIMLYQTNSFVIAHVVGAESVTTYDIAYKYAGIFQMVFSIALSPIWAASAEAYLRNDLEWIYKAISKLNKLLLIIGVASIVQLLVSQQLYKLWIGEKVSVTYLLTFLMQVYFIVGMRGGIYCMVLNGLGKIKLQFIFNMLEALIHIPLSIFLGKIWGVNGVVFSMCLVVSFNAIWMPRQCKAVLAGTAEGIWSK